MATNSNPRTVTGGCLCSGVSLIHASVRSAAKTVAALSTTYYMHTVTDSEITWLSKSTYAEYNSSPGCYRSFCRNCGSAIAWTDRGESTDVEIAVGTIDEQFLVGDRDSEDKPLGAYGIALVNPEANHFYIRNQVLGVTDRIATSGTKFWKNTKKGPMGKSAD